MKLLIDFDKDVEELRRNILNEIRNFFSNGNKHIVIDIDEVEGSGICVRGDKIASEINSKGISGEQDFSFDELDLVDLSYLVGVINDYISEEEKEIQKPLKEEKRFPNGFSCWMETHFEIVSAIAIELNGDNKRSETNSPVINKRYSEQGTGGMYELAEELTDEFEALNEGREWDGEFFDEVELFIKEKLKL